MLSVKTGIPAGYTVTPADNMCVLILPPSATVTIPAASEAFRNVVVLLKRTPAVGNATISGTINGNAGGLTLAANDCVWVGCSGGAWGTL